ncbi:MAG: hypothetical protein ABIK65_16085 [Candidatus Eisenbacteria bacterium]
MSVIHAFLMLGGGAAMVFGFWMFGERRGGAGWVGAALLFLGLGAAFVGVLLAFAPRFFS